jgi:hypothetical protein
MFTDVASPQPSTVSTPAAAISGLDHYQQAVNEREEALYAGW